MHSLYDGLVAGMPTADALTSLDPDLWAMGVPPLDKVLRTVAVYLGILLIVRVAGKRLLAQMNSLDLVVVLLLSNVVQNAIIGADNSLTGGLLGAVVLVAANAALDRLSHRYPQVYRLVQGRPSTVVADGRVDERALTRLGLTRTELHWALRHQGADDVHEVARATLDPGGALSVDLRPADQAASRGDLDAAMAQLRDYLDARLEGGATPPGGTAAATPDVTSEPPAGRTS